MGWVLGGGSEWAAGGYQFVDLNQPVRAPEGLAVDDHVGRAERAAGDRFVHFDPGAVLDRLIADAGADFVGREAELRADRDGVVHGGNVDVVDEVGPAERFGYPPRAPLFFSV